MAMDLKVGSMVLPEGLTVGLGLGFCFRYAVSARSITDLLRGAVGGGLVEEEAVLRMVKRASTSGDMMRFIW